MEDLTIEEVCLSFLEESYSRFIELIDGWDIEEDELRKKYIQYVIDHISKVSKNG